MFISFILMSKPIKTSVLNHVLFDSSAPWQANELKFWVVNCLFSLLKLAWTKMSLLPKLEARFCTVSLWDEAKDSQSVSFGKGKKQIIEAITKTWVCNTSFTDKGEVIYESLLLLRTLVFCVIYSSSERTQILYDFMKELLLDWFGSVFSK